MPPPPAPPAPHRPLGRELQTTTPAAPSADAAPAALSPAQLRFNALIARIEEARATLAAWQAQIPVFHRAHLKRVVPLIEQLREGRRAAVELADALLDQPGWSKAEAASLRDWLLERAGEILEADDGSRRDPALLAIFLKHGGVDPQAPAPSRVTGTAEGEGEGEGAGAGGESADTDAHADAEADVEADFVRRVEEELAAREAREAAAREQEKADARAARGGKAGRRKTGKGRGRGEGAANDDSPEDAAQSVREVFRKLVSVLHPDREADPARRAEKTELMQRVNRAYAAQDLLGLLELQLQVAQVDASLLRDASEQRLRHYNRVLADQLAGLKQDIQQVQWQFEADFGLARGRLLRPDRLDRLVDQAYREVSALVADQQQEIRILADRSATRQWLRAIRRHFDW